MIVKIDNNFSHEKGTNIGLSQGAVLSPLLFIIFINDLELHLNNNIKLVLYADDVTIGFAADSPEELNKMANDILTEFSTWCARNKLVLNMNKTTHIQFHKRREPPLLDIKNYDITRSKTTKFLGLLLDENLTWSNHIELVCKKLNSAFFAIRNLKPVMSKSKLLNVYYGIVYSHLRYLILLWGVGTEVDRVFILQKKIIRLMFSLMPLDSCRPVFIQNKILTLTSIFIFEGAVFVHKNKQMFTTNFCKHTHNTRAANQISINKYRLSLFRKSPFVCCACIFNTLPTDIKNQQSFSAFKNNLKQYLISKCFYSLQDFFG